MLKKHGFEDIKVEPFSEAEGLGADRKDVWRLPWTVISARKSRTTSKRKKGTKQARA
jgi:hypothetical protein